MMIVSGGHDEFMLDHTRLVVRDRLIMVLTESSPEERFSNHGGRN